jgi:Rrf2 family nitric oxide-sensitive transcriptional repressor
VECFEPASSHCSLTRHCRLKGVLQQATAAYLAVLDGVTLADLVAPVNPQVAPPLSRKAHAAK